MSRFTFLAFPLLAALSAAQQPGTAAHQPQGDSILLLVQGSIDQVDVTSAWRKPAAWQDEHVHQPTGWIRVFDAAGNELAKVHFDLSTVNRDRGATKGQMIVHGDTLLEGRVCRLVKIPDLGDQIARLDFESIEADGVRKVGSTSGLTLQRVLNATAMFKPAGAPTVRTHINNGPIGNRYDIVCIADAYTAAQEATFVADVNKWTANLFAKEPFKTYAKFFNVHSVFQASNQDLADKPMPCQNPPVVRDTIYDAKYCTGGTDRCLYINNTALASTHAALAPDVEGRIVVFVNDPKYGGCASTFAVSYNGTEGPEVQTHEFGHSFGGLADEYGGDVSCYAGAEPTAVNVTKDSTAAKWSLWKGINGVGAFEGGQYYDKCIYRPKNDCLMRTLGVVLCEVCKEELVLDGYTTTNPIENPLPAAAAVSVSKPAVQAFSFTNLVPAASNPLIRWYVDNALQQTGGTSYNFNSAAWSAGAHTLRLEVFDQTAMVKKDPGNKRTRTRSGTVNVNDSGAYTTYGVGCVGSGTGGGAHVVVPAAYASKWGESANYYPHGRPNVRYQQVFLGSEVGTRTLIGCAFRLDDASTGPAASIPISVWLGGTTKTPTNLSTTATFAGNFDSAPQTLVFSGTWNFPANGPANTDLTSFKPQIPFTAPYVFTATAGRNLLYQLDQTGTGSDIVHGFDSAQGATANTARVFATPIAATPTGSNNNFGLVMCFLSGGTGQVLPKAYATAMGNSNNYYPWGKFDQHYQQIFDQSETTSATWGSVSVRQTNTTTGGAGGTQTVVISLGYSPFAVNALTTSFAGNWIAGTQKQVFSGTINIPTLSGTNANPAQFAAMWPFTTPFVHTAQAGRNLLLDVVNSSTADVLQYFDATAGGNTSRLFASPRTSATGTFLANSGVIHRFNSTSGSGGVPALSNVGVPEIGKTFQITLGNAKANTAAAVWLGATQTNIPLPPALAPGCTLYASFEILPLAGVATNANGAASIVLGIPNVVALRGVQFYNEWYVWDPGVNNLNLVFSNGGSGKIGG